ncbi:MAG: sodium/solute symporter [Phycisphaeraceae bacterium]|nr:sodium/solute symporter [Phycisphaeraceae bacterium]
MTLHWIDQIIIMVYVLAMAGIGFYFVLRNKSTDEYFAGGRSHGGILLGLSLVGAHISSITFIAHPADAYKTAYLRFLPALILPLTILIAGMFFVPLYRKARVTSAYEYLEARFGPGVRLYAASMFAIYMLLRLSAVLFLFSVVIKTITGLDADTCILIAGIITAAYTVVGGLNAVIWTDAIQSVVLLGGGLAILLLLLIQIPGGLGEVLTTAWADNKLSVGDLNPATGAIEPTRWFDDMAHKSVFLMLLMGTTNWMTAYCTSQDNVQRYVAAKSAHEARKSIWLCTAMSIPVWATFMFMGTCMYVFYKKFPDEQAALMLTGGRKAEDILPYYLTSQVPVGVVGLVVSGVAAAAMSTLSANLNSFSSVVTVDIYRRLLVRHRSDRHYLRAGWIFTGLSALVMVLGALALLHASTKTLNDFLLIVGNIVQVGILAVFLLGFLTRRANSWSVGLGILFTLLFSTWCVLSGRGWIPEGWAAKFDLYYVGPLGNLLLFAIGFFLGYLIPCRHLPEPRLTIWGHTGKDEDDFPLADQPAQG